MHYWVRNKDTKDLDMIIGFNGFLVTSWLIFTKDTRLGGRRIKGGKLERTDFAIARKKKNFIVKVSNKDVSYLVTDNEVVSRRI